MSDAASDPHTGFQDVVQAACTRLDLSTAVELVVAEDWGMQPGADQTVIYAPPYREDAEHILLHYLATMKMLEDGWKMPLLRHDDQIDFLLANRSADAFTDFWAYHVVADVFGDQHLTTYTAGVVETEAATLLTRLQQQVQDYGFSEQQAAQYRYVYSIDWFGMAPALLHPFDRERSTGLQHQFERLLSAGLQDLLPGDAAGRVGQVNALFQTLFEECGGYRDLEQENAFQQYYGTVWDAPPAAFAGFTTVEELGEAGLNNSDY